MSKFDLGTTILANSIADFLSTITRLRVRSPFTVTAGVIFLGQIQTRISANKFCSGQTLNGK